MKTKDLQTSISPDAIKLVVALRAARSAIGWSQEEFAEKLEVAKSTVARIETLEFFPKAELLTKAMRVIRQGGVNVDLFQQDVLTLVVEPAALSEAAQRLNNELLRRSDRDVKRRTNIAIIKK